MGRLFKLLGGRKLVIVLLFTSLGCVMQFLGKFDSNMTTLFLGLAGIFTAGNGVEYLTQSRQNNDKLSRSDQ
jgi:hypothetical protein